MEMRPDDAAFFETVRPFRTHFPHRFQLDIFAVSRDRLGLSEAELHRIAARTLRPTQGLTALVSPFLSRLANIRRAYEQPVADRLADSAVDLLSVVATEQLGRHSRELPGAERVLLLSVQRFIRWNLESPDLTPGTVARAHGISVRICTACFRPKAPRWAAGRASCASKGAGGSCRASSRVREAPRAPGRLRGRSRAAGASPDRLLSRGPSDGSTACHPPSGCGANGPGTPRRDRGDMTGRSHLTPTPAHPVFSTGTMPPEDRSAAWRRALSECYVPVEAGIGAAPEEWPPLSPRTGRAHSRSLPRRRGRPSSGVCPRV